LDLVVLYEDNHLIAVDKPPGLASQPDRTGDACILDVVKDDLRRRYAKPGEVYLAGVHRLDRPACGALLMAKTSKAAARMSELFREGRLDKTYLAVVDHAPGEASGRLTDWLVKDAARNTSRVAGPRAKGAKEAVLDYKVIVAGAPALLAVRLLTGRSHQIRVQLSHIGSPVAGDRRYGSKIALGSAVALHCAALRFEHPVRKEIVTIAAAAPESWRTAFGAELFHAAVESVAEFAAGSPGY
jgi:23S rRNA pseudouridine1911/1915/1917 synthase